jgi:hypothetical protein
MRDSRGRCARAHDLETRNEEHVRYSNAEKISRFNIVVCSSSRQASRDYVNCAANSASMPLPCASIILSWMSMLMKSIPEFPDRIA